VTEIREQSLQYVPVMKNSRKVRQSSRRRVDTVYQLFDATQIADDGRALAEDAILLCKYLANGVPADRCYAFVKNMLGMATKARELSEDTINQFSQIRVNLLRVSFPKFF
jgi:hypothetical protein